MEANELLVETECEYGKITVRKGKDSKSNKFSVLVIPASGVNVQFGDPVEIIALISKCVRTELVRLGFKSPDSIIEGPFTSLSTLLREEVYFSGTCTITGKYASKRINAPSEYQLDRMIAKCDNVINRIVIPGKVRSHFSATVETYELIV